jgi:two-component system sensor histidine kinase ChvG
MASATATARPEKRTAKGTAERRRWLPGSKLGRLIIALNLIGLAVLIVGALVLNEFRQSLIVQRTDSLRSQGELIVRAIAISGAVSDTPEPEMDYRKVGELLLDLSLPTSQRVRLFDRNGVLVFDSYLVSDRVEVRPLPPAHRLGELRLRLPLPPPESQDKLQAAAEGALAREVARALVGQPVSDLRSDPGGGRVVSVSLPIQTVRAVAGVLTLEAGDVDQIIAAQRRALLPFILVAIATTILTSLMLSAMIAQPVLRLARAADRVRLSRARAISLPDLAKRDDELGDLTRALESMTDALSTRIDAIERFAADVAHEIRNPLTSIRSAIDTLPLIKHGDGRERLLAILQQDVNRLDRLVTDISNASRLDAELSREPPRAFDLKKLLSEIVALYGADLRPGGAPVRFVDPDETEPLLVSGREGPIGQVFRNLIDNARSFSPPGGEVRVSIGHMGRNVRAFVDDDGPGVPAENLETVFERFYTSRPKGAAFGSNSGLGLSIARQIVEAHDGRIWAENREDAEGRVLGARFGVQFPEKRPEPVHKPRAHGKA